MRVTSNMLGDRTLQNLDRIRERMYRLETDLATGTWLHRPSDSPADVVNTVRLRDARQRLTRYQRNMDDAAARLRAAESAISDLVQIVRRASELAVQGANDTYSPEARKAIALEMDELLKYAVQAANATYGDEYLFAGWNTGQPAFTLDMSVTPPIKYNGDTGVITRQIAPGQSPDQWVVVNVTGNVLRNAGGIDLFGALANAASNLRNQPDQLQTSIDELQRVTDHLLQLQATIGARQRVIELSQDRALDLQVTLEQHVEQTSGVDIEKALIDFKREEAAYQTALGMAARILPPSLLDFLR